MAGGLEERPYLRTEAIHKIQGPRKAYHQQAVPVREIEGGRRGLMMADQARSATLFFADLEDRGVTVDWKTLEFRLANHGTEEPGTELWRWEVWIS